MPDLAQLVNALLRDVARARFASDLYARDVARYYEADGLLRRFPVPRPELAEVEFDLKFLVDGFQLEPTQHELAEATRATVLEPYADRITGTIVEAAEAQLGQEPVERQAWARSVTSASARIDLRQAVLKVLTDRFGRSTGAPPPDLERIGVALRATARAFVRGHLHPAEAQRAAAEALAESAAGAAHLAPILLALQDELARAAADRGDCRVEVTVAGDRLAQAAAGTISSVRVKAAIRNYVWTQVEAPADAAPTHEDGKPSEPARPVWRALNAE